MGLNWIALGWFLLRQRCVSSTVEMLSSAPNSQLSAFSNLRFSASGFTPSFHALFSQRMRLQIGFIVTVYLCVIMSREHLTLNYEMVLCLILTGHRLMDCGCLLCRR